MIKITNAKTMDDRKIDLVIDKDRIISVTDALNHDNDVSGRQVPGNTQETDTAGYERCIDAAGYMILPPFVDTHTHLDKTTVGMDWVVNALPPYLPAWVENERRRRDEIGIDSYRQACRLIERDLSYGTIAIRSHVDIDLEHGLRLFDGVMKAREEYKNKVYIELVAFPQSGLLVRPGTYELMSEALSMGADLVGGIDPANIDRDPKGGVDAIFRLAEKYDKPIDIHLHEPGHLGAFTMNLIIERTKAAGMEGRVTISHAFCLGYPETGLAEPLIEKLADAKIAVTTGGQAYIKYVPSVLQLEAAGVLICGGNDNVRDLWSPYGTGDMLERAMLISMKNGLRRDDLLVRVLRMCSENGARLLHISDYGLSSGCDASFVLVRAQSAAECVAQAPKDRIVLNHGQIL